MEKEIVINKYDTSIIDQNVMLKIENILNHYYLLLKEPNNFHTIREILPVIFVISETYDYIIDKEKWNKIIFQYMEYIRDHLVAEGYNDRLSLFDGMAEIGLGVTLLNQATGHYSHFLQSINNYIIESLQPLVQKVIQNITNLKTQDFDCIKGLSGIISYLMHVENKAAFDNKAIYDSISYLISVGMFDRSRKPRIPRWYIKAKNQSNQNENVRFLLGHINYSLAHGIAGVLVALSLSLKNGIELMEQKKCIKALLDEYERLMIVDNGIPYWPGQYAYERYVMGDVDYDNVIQRMSWCYGTPGILTAIRIGADSIKDNDLISVVDRYMHNICKMEISNYKFNSPILCHGYAGLLVVLANQFRTVKFEKSEILRKKMEELVMIIMEYFNPTNPFLFEMSDYDIINGNYELVPVHSNSFLVGTSGIILSLLSVLKKTKWETHLLIK